MKIYNTSDPQEKPSVVMLIYGEGGVGKTSFGATAPKPLLADCENGAKYFGLRGIKTDIAVIEKWSDMKDYADILKTKDYQTAVLDPIGELMDKLKRHMAGLNDAKLTQKDGNPTMTGWGWLKKAFRDYIKFLRDSGKHVILVAHIDEVQDDNRLVKRPKIETKLSSEIVNMVDVVAYMTVIQDTDGTEKRILMVDPSSDKFVAKDRTGQLGKVIPPNFSEIIEAIHGTKEFKWAKAIVPKKEVPKKEEPKLEKAETDLGIKTEVNAGTAITEPKESELVAVNHLDMPEAPVDPKEKTRQNVEKLKNKLKTANE